MKIDILFSAIGYKAW